MLEKDQEDLDLDFEKDSNGINRVYLYNNFFIVILKNLYLIKFFKKKKFFWYF